jgi:Ca2+-binding EF-hand superfamily protein
MSKKKQTLPSTRLPAVVVSSTQLDDLKDAFNFFDQGKTGSVSLGQLKSLMQIFGMGGCTRREVDAYLAEAFDTSAKTLFTFNDVLKAVSGKWTAGGRENEFKQLYRIFDRKDKGFASPSEVRSALTSHLGPLIEEGEAQELLELAGIDTSEGQLTSDYLFNLIDKKL